jgi:RNA polymerase sigma factor (sigma-70 family)
MPAHVLKLLAAAAPDAPDADLLARFVAARDEAAFAALVRRHGPAVYRVCRRLVGPSAADDAFQSTFLVLACRAKAVRKAASVGSWLIGVAGRVARQMRRRARIHASRDRQGAVELTTNPLPGGRGSPEAAELASILADELTRLPDPLRTPVVLCLVEGQTQEQAAAALGGSVRTLRRRLDRAKALLRLRLERRGVVPAVAAGLVASLEAEAGTLQPVLTDRTIHGVFEFLTGGPTTPAVAVAKGVVGSMAKLKVSGLMAASAAVVIGLGVGWANDSPPKVTPPPAERPARRADAPPARPRPAEAAEPRTVIRFTGPAGMRITWQQPGSGFDDMADGLAVLGDHAFTRGRVHRLRLTRIPDFAGKAFYPTLEVAAATPKTKTFLEHASVPVAFTEEDFDQAAAGNLVVKVVYLPDPEFRDLTMTLGAEEITSPRLEPGADPIVEAQKRGTVLAIVRLGNIDLENPVAPAKPAPPANPTGVTDRNVIGHRTANFVVTAPTPVMARAVAAEAEYQRKALAERWLGKELSTWPSPCPIRVKIAAGHGGATTFGFEQKGAARMTSAEMELRGSFESVLGTSLPHEVMHTVLATHFGKPVLRWADEGIALTAEPPEEQARHDTLCRQLLDGGKAIRLRVLFTMTDYPRDMIALYAQGHSVTRFLLAYPGRNRVPVLGELPLLGRMFQVGSEDHHRRLVAFVALGMDGKGGAAWDRAAKQVYGFESVDQLEERWIEWLKTPDSRLTTPPLPKPVPVDPDHIPPTKLSDTGARPKQP